MSTAEFGAAFKRFMDAMVSAAEHHSPLLERITGHLADDPSRLPVIAEEFDNFEHPNVQTALNGYMAGGRRQHVLTGVAAQNRRFMALGLSDLISMARSGLTDGPVDYVNFHLDGDRVLPSVRMGLYLVSEGDVRLIVFVTGPNENVGPRGRLRVEAMGRRTEDCDAFFEELRIRMRAGNVYRGYVISLSPGQMGMGPQTLVEFRNLP